jgi:hypothetical protein
MRPTASSDRRYREGPAETAGPSSNENYGVVATACLALTRP